MHRRSVSSSSTSSYAGPSRFRAEAEAQLHPKAGFAQEDQIVCQTKLFDAFELQELEQQLDRKLNLVNHHKSLLFSRESPNYEKSLVSVSNLLNDRLSPADQLQENAGCACNSCNSNVKTPSLSSLINDSAIPKCKESLIAASNMLMQPDDHLQVQGGCSCNQPANIYDQLHDEKTASYERRSYSMPRSHYNDITYAGDQSQADQRACLDAPAQEALQDLQVHADQRAIISSKTKELKVQKQIRAKSSRWSLANSLFRSLKAMHKNQDHAHVVQDAASTSTSSLNLAKPQHNNEYHHHHNIVHYHHVYHHHHVVNSIHFEEIDWPLSPARLQELGWMAHVKNLN